MYYLELVKINDIFLRIFFSIHTHSALTADILKDISIYYEYSR